MHVLIVCEYGSVNGGERSLLAALERTPGDVSVTVLAPADGRFAGALSGQQVRHVPFSVFDPAGERLPAENVVKSLSREVERLTPCVVHANSLSMGRITGRLANIVSVPCTAHLRDIVGVSRTAARHLSGNKSLVAVSEATRAFHVAQGIDARRIIVLPNGIDCERWRPRAPCGFLWNLLRLPEDAQIAAFVGQIGMRKGLDVLIEAVIGHRAKFPQLHFVLIGERTSGKAESIEFERSLHNQVDAAGLSERFHWLGYRDDVELLLNEADLLIHPARQEPFGRVLLEAAACGVPIIATRVGGTTEMLTDDESAILVPPDDSSAIAAALLRLVADADLRQRLGAAARDRIVGQFDLRDRAEDLFNFWRKAAGCESGCDQPSPR